jgi:IS30 family transposase
MIGKNNQTAIGTLVERTTGYAMLMSLPDGYKPENVAPALTRKIQTLPETLRRSLTWDQGPEMRDWKQVSIAASIQVYFCDPHAPWQRGSNENTNGLLRQYFPKGTDFSHVTEAQLDAVADETQRPTPQTPRVLQTHRTPGRATVAIAARIPRTVTGHRLGLAFTWCTTRAALPSGSMSPLARFSRISRVRYRSSASPSSLPALGV